MPVYLLSVIQPADGERPVDDVAEQVDAAVQEFHAELRAAGAWVFACRLEEPQLATVVDASAETLRTDGPWTEGKEFIGGACIVKASDLEAALEWGRKASAATRFPVEVRPFADV